MIYTDKVHLVADHLWKLHEFAQRIGLKRHFFEGVKKKYPHYDLTNDNIKLRITRERNVRVVLSKKVLEISKQLYK